VKSYCLQNQGIKLYTWDAWTNQAKTPTRQEHSTGTPLRHHHWRTRNKRTIKLRSMTLILGCITPKFAIHVSDRNISKDKKTVDGYRNKGTLVKERFVLAYSGPAELYGVNTDIWLARLLLRPPANGDFWGNVVAQEAANAISQKALNQEGKRLAIVAMGWSRARHDDDYPAQIVISNALYPDGTWMNEARPDFTVSLRQASGTDDVTITQPIGANVEDEETFALRRGIRGVMKAGGSPTEIARLMGNVIRAAANRSPAEVSTDYMVTIIPKPSLQSEILFATGDGCRPPANVTHPSTYLVRNDDTAVEWVMPNCYTKGWLLTNMRFEYGKPGGGGSIAVDIERKGSEPLNFAVKDEFGRVHVTEFQPDGSTPRSWTE